MEFSLLYCRDQLQQAGHFIYKNNPYVSSWECTSPEDVEARIYHHMVSVAKENAQHIIDDPSDNGDWTHTASTGGWSLSFSYDGDGIICVDVTVDPAIGMRNSDYQTDPLNLSGANQPKLFPGLQNAVKSQHNNVVELSTVRPTADKD